MDKQRRAFSYSPNFLLLCAAILGAFSTFSQVLIFREELVLLEGNELVLSSLLCCWLLGLSFGAAVPRWFCFDRFPGFAPGLILCAPLILWLSILITRCFISIFAIPPEEVCSPIYVFILSVCSVFPAGLFYGFCFSLMAILFKNGSEERQHSKVPGETVGSIFSYEAIGSVTGGLILVFYLLPGLNTTRIILATFGFALIIVSLGNAARPVIMVVFAFFSLLVFILLQGTFPDTLNSRSVDTCWHNQHPGYELKFVTDTPYQRLELGVREEQFTLYGNGVPLFSFPNEYEFSQWGHLALSQNSRPRSVLVIGTNGVSGIKALVEHQPYEIVCIDLDPQVQILEHQFENWKFMEAENTIITMKPADPRSYISSLPPLCKFSVIALNQPDPSNGLTNRVYTMEFFKQLASHLEAKGVLTLSITGTPNNSEGDVGLYGATIYWTLKKAFTHVLVLPGTKWVFFASNADVLSSDPKEIIRRFEASNIKSSSFLSNFFTLYYEPERIGQLQKTLDNNKNILINKDQKPVCYLYSIVLWLKQHGYLQKLPLTGIANQSFWTAGFYFMALFGLVLFFLVFSRLVIRAETAGLIIPFQILASAGFTGMGAQLSILLFYQTQAGSLYKLIGIFFGVFMGGMAMGSQEAIHRLRKSKNNVIRQLLWADLRFSLLLFITPVLIYFSTAEYFSVPAIEIMLLAWTGWLAYGMGYLFPLCAAQIEIENGSVNLTAAYTVLSDNVGGAFGALITGIVLIPFFGIMQSFLLFASIKFILLVLAWRKQPKGIV